MAYVDVKTSFDSLDRMFLLRVLKARSILDKLIGLLKCLYSNTSNTLMVNWRLSDHFVILSGVRQGYMVAPSLFNTAMTY